MDKIDYKQKLKHLYQPSARRSMFMALSSSRNNKGKGCWYSVPYHSLLGL